MHVCVLITVFVCVFTHRPLADKSFIEPSGQLNYPAILPLLKAIAADKTKERAALLALTGVSVIRA